MTYCLRPRKDKNPAPPPGPASGPIIPRHFSSAIFEIGTDVLVKVKWALEGWPKAEGQAMRLVRDQAPEVPVPEAIHFWHDEEWARYFVIMRRVHGRVLDEVWFTLAEHDKKQVAQEMATYIRRIAAITSPRFEVPGGEPMGDGRLVGDWAPRSPWEANPGSWPGPFHPDEFRQHLTEVSDGVEPPEIGSQFYLYHGDPTPSNVIVTGTETAKAPEDAEEEEEEGVSHVHVAGIIDWEMAGFYPEFWILLFPVMPMTGFELSLSMEQMQGDLKVAVQQAAEYRDGLEHALAQGDLERVYALMRWWGAFDAGHGRYIKKMRDLRKAGEGPRVE